MATDQYIVLGEFKGLFKTSQELPMGLSDKFPVDFVHSVRIYKGSLTKTTFETSYTPEKHRQLQSFVLNNVPNISVEGQSTGPFPDKRICTFEQFILVDPKIERTYQLNEQTYGELSGKAYGITMQTPSVGRIDPKPFGETNLNPDSTVGSAASGCSTLLNGCLANLWRILLYILALLIFWWLVRACNQVINDNEACDRKEMMHEKLIETEKRKRELEKEYAKHFQKYLKTVPNIFFYRNSVEVHILSKKQHTIEKWAKLIKACSEKKFAIVGHHTGLSYEGRYENIDLRRSRRIKSKLLKLGVKRDQIICESKGDSVLKYAVKMRQIKVGKRNRIYNKNMRVELVEAK